MNWKQLRAVLALEAQSVKCKQKPDDSNGDPNKPAPFPTEDCIESFSSWIYPWKASRFSEEVWPRCQNSKQASLQSQADTFAQITLYLLQGIYGIKKFQSILKM